MMSCEEADIVSADISVEKQNDLRGLDQRAPLLLKRMLKEQSKRIKTGIYLRCNL